MPAHIYMLLIVSCDVHLYFNVGRTGILPVLHFAVTSLPVYCMQIPCLVQLFISITYPEFESTFSSFLQLAASFV
jgi:hypothetical protein